MPIRHPRPDSIKLISYAVLAYAAAGIGLFVLLKRDGGLRGHPVLTAYAAASPVLHAICGWFMLKGANWARLIFFPCLLALIGFLVYQEGPYVALGFAPIPIVVTLLLITKDANRFFAGRSTIFKRPPESAEEKSSRRGQRYDY